MVQTNGSLVVAWQVSLVLTCGSVGLHVGGLRRIPNVSEPMVEDRHGLGVTKVHVT